MLGMPISMETAPGMSTTLFWPQALALREQDITVSFHDQACQRSEITAMEGAIIIKTVAKFCRGVLSVTKFQEAEGSSQSCKKKLTGLLRATLMDQENSRCQGYLHVLVRSSLEVRETIMAMNVRIVVIRYMEPGVTRATDGRISLLTWICHTRGGYALHLTHRTHRTL
jgi:hypothetical protein